MKTSSSALVGGLAALLCSPPSQAEENSPSPAATSTQSWTTSERAEGEPEDGALLALLDLPRGLLEAAFTPVIPVLAAFEGWQLQDRVIDLVSNDERTRALIPVVDFLSRSGLGAGAAFLMNDPLGSADRLVILALARTNRDRQVSASIARRLPTMSGRLLTFSAAYAVDHDLRYYGLSGARPPEDRRLLRVDSIDVSGGIGLSDPAEDSSIRLDLAYRHRALAPGVGPEAAVGGLEPDFQPAGFGQSLNYPEVTLRLQFDSRDSLGRTNRGMVGELSASITHDLDGAATGGIRGTATLGLFVPLLPLHRVLFLSAGASIAAPLGGGGIPLHHLVHLGGSSTLRGYETDRFVDRLGWWATAEYRYHLYQVANTGNGFSAALFADFGQVGPRPLEVFESRLRWSVGAGLRLETDLFLLARLQLAYSPEGVQLTIAVGELL